MTTTTTADLITRIKRLELDSKDEIARLYDRLIARAMLGDAAAIAFFSARVKGEYQ